MHVHVVDNVIFFAGSGNMTSVFNARKATQRLENVRSLYLHHIYI